MKAHDDAFLALIRSAPDLADYTFEGTVTNRPARYVSVFTRESRAVGRFTGPHGVLDNEYIAHSVGTTPSQAKAVRELWLPRVLDVTPIISGWVCKRVRFVTSQPLALDRDANTPLWFTVDVLAFESEKV